jgi:hypothetical protein
MRKTAAKPQPTKSQRGASCVFSQKSRIAVIQAMEELARQSPEKQLQWLLGFLEKDLEALSPSEKIRDGFLLRTIGKERAPIVGAQFGDPMSTERLGVLHGQIASGLRQLLSPSGQWMLPEVRTSGTLYRAPSHKKEWRVWLETLAVEPEGILHSVARLLEQCGSRLRACAHCQRAFLIEDRRQVYCSKGCAQAVTHERYRRRHREELRTRRREAYQRKKQGELGPKVKIGQRRREGV